MARETLFEESDPWAAARFLGTLAVRRGVVDEETLADCLREHQTASRGGATVLLEQVLIRRGAVQSGALALLLKERELARRRCTACSTEYLYTGAPGREPACPGCGSPLVRPGQDVKRIGKYEIVREIGKGGMGIVYLARDPALHREVAIKVLRESEFAEGAQIERFLQEARHAARIRHPNIVSIHEIGEDQGRPYFVMDHVPGRTLAELLKEGSFHRRHAIRILELVARALHEAHRQGLVHRDVKPGNVIVDVQDRPYVLDFGLSKATDASHRLTRTGAPMGTPFYMSPEQVDGAEIDARTDVYALGVILYEILTGDLPHRATSVVKMYHEIVHGAVPRPRNRDATIPARLESICLTAIQKDREKRYPTAEAFADDLRRYLDGKAVAGSRRRTIPRAALAGAAVLCVALAVLGGVLATRSGEEPPTPPGPTEPIAPPADPTRLVIPVAIVAAPGGEDVDLAVFYEPRYRDDDWVRDPARLAAFLSGRGFELLDSRSLRGWMQARIGTGRRGVVVFARVTTPESIVESFAETSTLRRFLDAGNSIVWLADIPLYWLHPEEGERYTVWATPRILGVRDGSWDDVGPALPTDAGRSWGLTRDGVLERPSLACDVTTVLSRSPYRDEAGSWHKNFDRTHPSSGFVKYWPDNPFPGADPELQANVERLALRAADRLPALEVRVPPAIDLSQVRRIELSAAAARGRISFDEGLQWTPLEALALPEGTSCVWGALLSIESRSAEDVLLSWEGRVHLHRSDPCLSLEAPLAVDSGAQAATVLARGAPAGEVRLEASLDGLRWEAIASEERIGPARWRLGSLERGHVRLRAVAEGEGGRAVALGALCRLDHRTLTTRAGVVWLLDRSVADVAELRVEDLADFTYEAKRALESLLGWFPDLSYRVTIQEGDRVFFTSGGLDVGIEVLDELSYMRRCLAQGLVYHAVEHGAGRYVDDVLSAPLRELLAIDVLDAIGRSAEADAAWDVHVDGGPTLLTQVRERHGLAGLTSWLTLMRRAGPRLASGRDRENLHTVLAYLVLAVGADARDLVRAAAAAGEFELDEALLEQEVRRAAGN